MVHLNNVTLRFEIWDTAGQEKYHSVTPLYYRGAHAALLVYDITKRVRASGLKPPPALSGLGGRLTVCFSVSQETFGRVQLWLRELESHLSPGSAVLWLVGNKGDLAQRRQVSVQVQTAGSHRLLTLISSSVVAECFHHVFPQEGQTLANDRGLVFRETSALSGDQVSELLLDVGAYGATMWTKCVCVCVFMYTNKK